jgi:hypothetical protein
VGVVRVLVAIRDGDAVYATPTIVVPHGQVRRTAYAEASERDA